jgi:hypothetical protein
VHGYSDSVTLSSWLCRDSISAGNVPAPSYFPVISWTHFLVRPLLRCASYMQGSQPSKQAMISRKFTGRSNQVIRTATLFSNNSKLGHRGRVALVGVNRHIMPHVEPTAWFDAPRAGYSGYSTPYTMLTLAREKRGFRSCTRDLKYCACGVRNSGIESHGYPHRCYGACRVVPKWKMRWLMSRSLFCTLDIPIVIDRSTASTDKHSLDLLLAAAHCI